MLPAMIIPRDAMASRSFMLLATLALCARADEYSHKYERGETVKLWVNKVGPYHNPQETYVYYSLPFCSTGPVDDLSHRWDGLGEVLESKALISSGYDFQFLRPLHEHATNCSLTTPEEPEETRQ